MRQILWTVQAQADLAAIHAFINLDSARHADDTVRQLIAAVYKLVGSEHVHILTIHHGSRQLPSQF